MEKNPKLFKIDEIISLRHKIHQNAELSCEEYKTRSTIKNFLLSKGVSHSQIKNCAETGMYITISGLAPKKGKNKLISYRAEMDGLKVKEKNEELKYKSVTNAAHLCGHDGHIAALLGGFCLFYEKIKTIPKNKKIRLIFQPAEENTGGARRMINEGVLIGVEEVWGLHNVPENPINKIYSKPDILCTGVDFIKIVIKGKGGHSSLKKDLIDPVFPSCKIVVEMEEYLEKLGEKINNIKIVGTLLKIETSSALNIIPDQASIEGGLRYFDIELRNNYMIHLKKIIKEIEKKLKVVIELNHYGYPPIINNAFLVKELKNLREDLSEEGLPKKFSEDFSEFSNDVKGCFFIYNIGDRKGGLHQADYDFNDDCLLPMSELWKDIMMDRLDLDN